MRIRAAGSSGVPVTVKSLSGAVRSPSRLMRVILPLALPPDARQETKSPTSNSSGKARLINSSLGIISSSMLSSGSGSSSSSTAMRSGR